MIRLLWILWGFLHPIIIIKICVKSYLFLDISGKWNYQRQPVFGPKPIREQYSALHHFFYRNLLNICITLSMTNSKFCSAFLSFVLHYHYFTEFVICITLRMKDWIPPVIQREKNTALFCFVSLFYRNLSKICTTWIKFKLNSMETLFTQEPKDSN